MPNQTICIQLPGNSTWIADTSISGAGPHSYKVQIGDSVYSRNRYQLISPRNDDRQANPDPTAPEDHETQLTPGVSSKETNPSSEPVEAPTQQSSSSISSHCRSSQHFK